MKRRHPHILVSVFTLAVIFSVQFPLPVSGSNYASINLSDLVILVIFIYFLLRTVYHKEWELSLSLPNLTVWFLAATVWIVLSTSVAVIRSPISVLANTLWTLKWLEILILFLLTQQYAQEIDWNAIIYYIVGGATIIAIATILHTATTAGWSRPTVFWQNPNTLAVFLALPSLVCLLYGSIEVKESARHGLAAILLGLILILGLGATGSRSGVITLAVGAAVAVILAHNRISTSFLVGGITSGLVLGIGGLLATGRFKLFQRFFPTITFQDGTILLTGPGTGGLYTRLRLTRHAVDLWQKQPIFGYGWFSSPENPLVGFLDVFYSQILVDVGIVGFILVMLFYSNCFRALVSRQTNSSTVVPVAGASWLLGLLVAGIGGGHARVPRIMFLLVLILVATAQFETEDGLRKWV